MARIFVRRLKSETQNNWPTKRPSPPPSELFPDLALKGFCVRLRHGSSATRFNALHFEIETAMVSARVHQPLAVVATKKVVPHYSGILLAMLR